MAKITILLYNKAKLFHFGTHLEAIIEDETTQRSFRINYAAFNILNNNHANKECIDNMQKNNECCTGSITLRSPHNYDQFIMNFYHDFGNMERYNYIMNNCSDAVDYALDYFFPKKTKTEVFYCLYKTLCCWLCLGSCGVKCFPVPPLISSPNDVFKKAQILACTYEFTHEAKQDQSCVCHSEGWDHNKLVSGDSCNNSLSLAIINEEKNITLHFFEKHLWQFNKKQIIFCYLCLAATDQHDLIKMLKEKRHDDLKFISQENEAKNEYPIISEYTDEEIDMLMTGKYNYHFAKYILDHHLDRPTTHILGRFLLQLVHAKKYEDARKYLLKRPDINKHWSFLGTDEFSQHLLASDPNADIGIFKILCESKPVCDLTKKSKAGETALTLAIKNKNTKIVSYLVKYHATEIKDQIHEAKEYLASLKAHAFLQGAMVRKKYRFCPLDTNHSIKGKIYALGNDPELLELKTHISESNGRPVIVGTSGLRSLKLTCQIGSNTKNKVIPQLIIIDISQYVIEFWKDFRKVIASEKSKDQLTFFTYFDEFFNRHKDHVTDHKSEDVSKFLSDLFSEFSYDHVRAIICNAVILAQSWANVNTFKKIKNIVNYMQTDNIYTYTSNIYVVESTENGIKLLDNIGRLQPKLAIHTNFDHKTLAPSQVYYFTDHNAEKQHQVFFPTRNKPQQSRGTVKIGDELFEIYDENDLATIQLGFKEFSNRKPEEIIDKMMRHNLIIRIDQPSESKLEPVLKF